MSILLTEANVLTLEKDKLKYLENVFVGITDKYIDYLGKDRPVREYDEVICMYNCLIIPGLINCHTHTPMVLMRGLGTGLPLQKWLEKMWAVEKLLRDEDFENGINLALLEMIGSGTTSFSDMYTNPEHCCQIIEQSGIKANISPVMMFGFDEPSYENYTRRIKAFSYYEKFNNTADGRLKVDFSVHAQYTTKDSFVQKFAQEIVSRVGVSDARLHIHLSETLKEHEDCIREFNKTPAQWFDQLGAFNVPTFAAHCVWCTEEDLSLLAEKNVKVVHNPSSNLKLGSGVAPITKMLEKKIVVCLGTDGAASNNNLNMLEEMHLACLLHNGVLNNASALSALQVFKMATVNGALLQGRSDCGSLSVGKCADLVALNLDSPNMQPLLDPLSQVLYSAQMGNICMTMVNGRILFRNGEYTTLDKDKILSEVRRSVAHLYRFIN